MGWKRINSHGLRDLLNKGVVELDCLKTDVALPDHAIQSDKERGGLIFVGRAHYKGGTHPGKVFKVGGKYIL
ncbi:MAG: hypothetical protein ACI86M_002700 [Saprospiraceae bacterium]|jgi:hypothetical protein